jgi:hypothetical protein
MFVLGMGKILCVVVSAQASTDSVRLKAEEAVDGGAGLPMTHVRSFEFRSRYSHCGRPAKGCVLTHVGDGF